MEVHPDPDGGATLRLSPQELVQYYNLLDSFLAEGKTWSDGTPMPDDVLRPFVEQLSQLRRAIGRPDLEAP